MYEDSACAELYFGALHVEYGYLLLSLLIVAWVVSLH